jgi:serine/threonine protein kinase
VADKKIEHVSPDGKKIRSSTNSKSLKSTISMAEAEDYEFSHELSTQSSGQIDQKINKDSFVKIKIIGRGSMGKVTLVKYKHSKHLFAMKTVHKPLIQDEEQKEQIMSERHVLLSLKNPFLVSLNYSFQDDNRLYYIFEYLRGGTLTRLMQKIGKLFENEAKLYVCEIILALEYLHQNDVVCQDLTPKNILLDS